VKHTRILAALLGVVTLLTTSCGVGDKLASVSMTAVGITGSGVINLVGLGSTIQLKVTAKDTSGKRALTTPALSCPALRRLSISTRRA
jgi:hypothetical protein